MGLVTITTAVRSILLLPPLTSSIAPELGSNIEEAKAFARQWLTSHAGILANGLGSVNSACIQWASFYTHQIGVMVDEGDAGKNQVKTLLQRTQGDSKAAQKLLKAVSKSVKADDSSLLSVTSKLNGDANLIQSKVRADKSVIQALQQRIADAQAKIDEYNKRQKFYWLAGPVGYLIAHEIDALASNVQGYQAELKTYNRMVASEQKELHGLDVTVTGVGNWMNAMNIAGAAFGGLDSGVDSVLADVSNTVDQIDGVDPSVYPVWAKAQIAGIGKNYEDVGRLGMLLFN